MGKHKDCVYSHSDRSQCVRCTHLIERDRERTQVLKMASTPQTSYENSAGQCNYYQVPVLFPQNPDQAKVPYTANCEDIIQALGLTFDEGCEFKSIWRRARARQGFAKAESTAVRDAAKAVHYANRVLAFEQRQAEKEAGQ